jgi:hypothetical protein
MTKYSQPPRCEEFDGFRRRKGQGWGAFSSPLEAQQTKIVKLYHSNQERYSRVPPSGNCNLAFPPQPGRKVVRARNADDGGRKDAMELESAMQYNWNLSLIFLGISPLHTLGNRPGRQTLIFIQYPSSRKQTYLIIYAWTSLSFKSLSPVNRSHACHSFSVAIKRCPYFWKRWICM